MSRKILVVDPDPIQLNIVDKELSDAGYEVLRVANGESALEVFAEQSPMLSIIEVNLPDLPGTELCQRIKTDPDLPGGLVVLVSAGVKDVTSVADATLRFRSDFHLHKPFQVAHLIWKTNELVNGRVMGRVGADGLQMAASEGDVPFTTDPRTASQHGELGDLDAATLILSFYLHRRSGSLLLVSGDSVRQIVFQEGFPVAADSNVHGEEYGNLAVATGTCEGGEMVRARGAWQNIDRHLGVIALSMGSMGARDHFRTMRAHVEAVLAGAMTLTAGDFYLEYGVLPEHFDGVSLAHLPPNYVMRGIREKYSDERCLDRLGETVTMVTADAAHFIIRELEQIAYYENVLGMFVRPTSVAMLIERGRVRRGDGLLQSILGLRTIGALWVTGDAERVRAAEPIARSVDLGFDGERGKKQRRDSGRDGASSPIGRVQPEARAVRPRPAQERGEPFVERAPRTPPKPSAGAPRRDNRDKLVAARRRISAEDHFEFGAERFGKGDYAGATQEFERAISSEPGRATYHIFLAQCLLLLDDRDDAMRIQAVEALKRAIQINPKKGDPFHLLGVALVELKRHDEAQFALRKALQLRTSHRKQSERLLEQIKRR